MIARDDYFAEFRRVKFELPGAKLAWLSRARERAMQRFADLGIPTTREEDWKYTNVALLAKSALPTAAAASVDAIALQGVGCAELKCELMVFVNGRYASELSKISLANVSPLADALENDSAGLEPYLDADNGDAFEALNLAFAADGALIRLRRNVSIERPIYLMFISTDDRHAIYPRNLILAEEGSRATIVEHYCGLNGAGYFTNAVTKIAAHANASVTHYKLQQEGESAYHIANIEARQQRDSRFSSHSLALGALLSRNEISTCFEGEGAETTLNGLYVAGGEQHSAHHTRIDHAQPRCTSREFYRGVLNDSARAVFNGKVIVRQGAQKTDSQQSNHNLLLSKEAEVDTQPQLEIYADDVKCTHGATIGQLDEDMIFYLRSRGVREQLAKAILTYAFAHEILGRIELPPLKRKVADALIARLPESERVREFV
jgi:Fe-S cluster assembly protein SufD